MEDTEKTNNVPEPEIKTESAETAAQGTSAVTETPECECAPDQQLASLEQKLSETQEKLTGVEKQAAEYLDGWQRSQAAFANFRKRTEAEQSQWRLAANAALLSRLLPVLDDFERAFAVLPTELEGNAWLEGLRLIQRKVQSILDGENAKPLELKLGAPFDPMYHHAVFYQETTDYQEGQIMAEIQKGYVIGERLLRPAMVVVAKAPVIPVQKTSEENTSGEETAVKNTGDVKDGTASPEEPAH